MAEKLAERCLLVVSAAAQTALHGRRQNSSLCRRQQLAIIAEGCCYGRARRWIELAVCCGAALEKICLNTAAQDSIHID